MAVLLLGSVSCADKKQTENPFFSEYKTPFGIPPFEQIKEEHYIPAFERGMEEQVKEIEVIVNQTDEPTFDNTIVKYNFSGELLSKVNLVFSNLIGAINNENYQAIAREIKPKLTAHKDNILLNPKLFSRIKFLYDNRSQNDYNDEQLRVIEKYYNDFVRSGANLNAEEQEQLRELNKQMSLLVLQFNERILAETNDNFRLIIDNEDDLAGLPQFVIDGAAETAKELGMEGKWRLHCKSHHGYPFYNIPKNAI